MAASLLTAVFCGTLLLMIWLSGGLGGGSGQAKSNFVATLTHTEQAVWAEGQSGVNLGARLPSGHRMKLETGLVHLLFRDGARVVVEGPATIRVSTTGVMTLEAGKLLAHVSKQAQGFTVHTPTVDVVDLGTEFGVNVTEGEAEVQVFEGMVQASRHGSRDSGRLLVAGKAAVFGNSPQQGYFVKEKKMNRAIYLSMATVLAMGIQTQRVEAIQIGPGASLAGPFLVDSGTPTDVDRTAPQSLLADTYNVLSFDVRVIGADGTKAVVPFLAIGSPSTYTTIWVGPSFAPTTDGVHTVTYTPDSEQFTLLAGQSVFAGIDSVTGAIVELLNGSGLTDHDSNSGLGPISLGQSLTGFSNSGLARTYAFDLVVEAVPPVPEPASGALLGLGGMMVLGFARRRRRGKDNAR